MFESNKIPVLKKTSTEMVSKHGKIVMMVMPVFTPSLVIPMVMGLTQTVMAWIVKLLAMGVRILLLVFQMILHRMKTVTWIVLREDMTILHLFVIHQSSYLLKI